MKRCNQKGMTLIEIIVVLLLSSVLMVIAGGLLLDSMGYFNKTAQSNYEKQAVDSISSYVREQLVYATEVQIATEKPDDSDDWHWLSVDKNYHLTRDDETVYNDGFYRDRRLKIVAKHYDNYRLDLSFAFTDEKNKQVYRTATTLELVNIKAKTEKGEEIKNTGIKGSEQKIGDTSSESGIYKIYYKVSGALYIKDDVDPNHEDVNFGETTNPEFEGTVHDELKCRDKNITKPGEAGNNKGTWQANQKYEVGDFVEYNGVTYRCVKKSEDGKNPQDNKGNCWKPINPPYWQSGASYLEDDVVIYKANGKYYEAEEDINNSNHSPIEDSGKWEELDEEELEEIKAEHKESDFCEIDDEEFSDGYWTVGGEKDRCGTDDNIKGPWKVGVLYNAGDLIEYPEGSNAWYRVTAHAGFWSNAGNSPDVVGTHLYKKISVHWDSQSTYFPGDIILFEGKYYQAYKVRFIDPTFSPEIRPDLWSSGYDTVEELLEGTQTKPTCDLKW